MSKRFSRGFSPRFSSAFSVSPERDSPQRAFRMACACHYAAGTITMLSPLVDPGITRLRPHLHQVLSPSVLIRTHPHTYRETATSERTLRRCTKALYLTYTVVPERIKPRRKLLPQPRRPFQPLPQQLLQQWLSLPQALPPQPLQPARPPQPPSALSSAQPRS